MLCQVTRNPFADDQSIELTDSSFADGSLHCVSYARPAKLFTANQILFTGVVGKLKPDVFNQLIDSVVNLVNQGRK
jgi:mRNA interferase MazF